MSKDDTDTAPPGDMLWMKDMSVILRQDRLLDIIPTPSHSTNELLNMIVRVGCYLGALFAVLYRDLLFLLFPLFLGILTILFVKLRDAHAQKEHFIEARERLKRNPFQNPLPFDQGMPETDSTQTVPNCATYQENDTTTFPDVTTDVFQKEQSQHHFHKVPVQDGGDHADFARFLYGNKDSCKDNPSQCFRGGY